MAQTKTTQYEVDIEGQIHEWDRETITVPELRELGNLPSDQPVIEVDLKDNSEKTLADDATITLKPGKGFGKKVLFKRG